MAKAKTLNIKKVSELLAECDIAEADLVGQIRKRSKKKTAGDMVAKVSPGKAGESFITLEMHGRGDVRLLVNKMQLKDSVGVLLLAGINLIRAEMTKSGDPDIHPALDLFMDMAGQEAQKAHVIWHQDPKNNRKKH